MLEKRSQESKNEENGEKEECEVSKCNIAATYSITRFDYSAAENSLSIS